VSVANARVEGSDLWRIGLFPLPNVVLFPAMLLTLHVFEPRYRRLVADAIENDLMLAVPRLRPGHDAEYYGAPPVFETCGVGRIAEHTRLPDGRYNIVVRGLSRVRLVEELRSQPYRMARAEPVLDREPETALMADAMRSELSKLVRRLLPHLSGPAKNLEARLRGAETPGAAADIVAGTLVEDPDARQTLLEELDPCGRMSWLIAHLHGLASRLSRNASGNASGSPERMN
jgi:Lon protease-like protein